MRRRVVISLAAGGLVAFSWLRLEEPRQLGRLPVLLGLALAPALLPRMRWRLAASLPALLLAAAVAFERSPEHVLDSARTGLRSFYVVALPLDPAVRPEMHGLLLLAIFAFSAAISVALAEGRPITAAAVFATGAGWPATLLPGEAALGQGALILVGVLLVLGATRPGRLPRLSKSAVAGGAVVVAALVAASFPAIARDQILDWENWDPYVKTDPSVGVQYVWDSNYNGVDFPDDPTDLLEIAASGQPRYWRATTLDLYRNNHWSEDLTPTGFIRRDGRLELTLDSDLPQAARRRGSWLEQQVRVRGLRDIHLVGASVPIAYAVDEGADFSAGGIAKIAGGTRHGLRYTVWSYSTSPNPRQLAASPPVYGPDLSAARYLEVERGVTVPPFGTQARHAAVLELIHGDRGIGQYERLYRIARRVGGASTPYGAVVAIETWLRTSPRFIYEEQPPRAPAGVPPLVDFVTRTRAGYCQHYAGAMALMLRYLGIPARVAVGFTSGRYDADSETWTVTDREAHAWVEVWFRGHGWLPFDPTPGRGNLAGPYTSASLGFRGREALEALGRESAGLGVEGRRAIEELRERLARERSSDPALQVPGGSEGDSRADPTFVVLLLGALGVATVIGAVKIVRRRLRYVGGGPRRIAGACRLELVDFVRDQGVDVRAAATLDELGEQVGGALAVDPGRFVAAAEVARFGPDASAEPAARSARRELKSLKRAIRDDLSARRRLRGLVSLRSLRA